MPSKAMNLVRSIDLISLIIIFWVSGKFLNLTLKFFSGRSKFSKENSADLNRFSGSSRRSSAKSGSNFASSPKSLVIDFGELAKFDPDLAEDLLEDPENLFKSAEFSLENFDLPEKNFRVRFKNLPDTQKMMIKDIRSIDLTKFIALEGIVRQASEVRPQVESAKFECPACGNNITILQLDTKFKEPTRCSCGRRGRFHLIKKD